MEVRGSITSFRCICPYAKESFDSLTRLALLDLHRISSGPLHAECNVNQYVVLIEVEQRDEFVNVKVSVYSS